MKILSLFDGMACGMIAMLNAGVSVDRYIAYEIDKYAVKTASHNFPIIEQRGDVFGADFTEFDGFDWLIGGSPCTHWSIAQTKDRETKVSRDEKGNILLHSSGIGFELFSQYLRALHEVKPRFFIYENNKSMSKDIREAIIECFGFEPTCINSALVSAQNRQRLYWVGRRNADGTYSKVNIEQPEDRGILLKDILDGAAAWRDKAYTIDAHYYKTPGLYDPNKQHSYSRLQAAEPVIENAAAGFRIYSTEAKGRYLCANGGGAGAKTGLYALPVDGPMKVPEATKKGYAEIQNGECIDLTHPNSKTRRGRAMTDKSNCCTASCQYYQYCAKLVYATPCEWDENGNPTKAVSCADGKTYTVYKIENGQITIKDKQYPIKLIDGYYIIRKLTVSECKRMQTVPDWYDFSCVSNSQAYKMLGNGWTCEVISYLIRVCVGKKGINDK